MSNAFLGQITMFGGNYAPRGTALCNGQTMSIAQNTALFSLLGTSYGGNGQTTFALPNLQSKLPIHQGQSPGLSNYTLGQTGGTPSVTLDQTTTPPHLHTFQASTSASNTTSTSIANNLVPGTPSVANAEFYANPPQPQQPPLIPHAMAAGVCSSFGGSQLHTNLMPSLCITFVIFLQGIFPSRN
jgi:microcystin-dependent protein